MSTIEQLNALVKGKKIEEIKMDLNGVTILVDESLVLRIEYYEVYTHCGDFDYSGYNVEAIESGRSVCEVEV